MEKIKMNDIDRLKTEIFDIIREQDRIKMIHTQLENDKQKLNKKLIELELAEIEAEKAKKAEIEAKEKKKK